jgi:hypothetical protein
MGLTKSKGKKASDYKQIDKSKDKNLQVNTSKEKGKGLANLFTSFEQAGLTVKDPNSPSGYKVDKENVVPGLANVLLKIPGVDPKDFKGIPPDVLQDWIKNSPEMKANSKDKGGGGGKGGGAGGATVVPGAPVAEAAPPPREVKGPGWISITRLLGKVRA